jgi:hypothetical protein
MKKEQTECSEMSAYKIQTPENYPEGKIQHTEHGKSLKSRSLPLYSQLDCSVTFCLHHTEAEWLDKSDSLPVN